MANTQGIRAGKAYVEIGTDNKALTKGLRAAQKQLETFGKGVRQIGQGLVAASAGIITPALLATQTFSEMGDAVAKMAKRTGVSVEALSELGFAAGLSGSSVEDLEKGLKKMARTVQDAAGGMATAKDALAGVGLTAEQLQKQSPEEQFKTLAQAFSQITDASKRAALAQEIFGRAGTQLIPLMDEGAAGIEAMQEQARALGLTISTETAADAELLNDTLDILKRSLKQVVFQIGAALSDTVVGAANAVTRFVTGAIAWVKSNKQVIVTVFQVAAAVGAVGAGLIGLGVTLTVAGKAIGVAFAAFAAAKAVVLGIGTVLAGLLSPVGLAVAAITGLGVAAVYYSGIAGKALEWLKEKFRTLAGFVSDAVGGVSDALSAGDLAAAAGVALAGLQVAFATAMRPIREIWAKSWAAMRVIAIEVWSAITGAFRNFRQFMEASFPNLTAGIVKVWSAMVFALRTTWAGFQKWLTDQVIKVWGFFDESVDVSAMLELNEQELQGDLAAIEAAHAKSVSEAMRKQQRTPEEVAAEHALEDANAEAQKLARELAIATDLNDGVEAAAKALADAHEKLRDAKRAAFESALAAEEKQFLTSLARRGTGSDDDIPDQLSDARDATQAKFSVLGTFNPAAVRALAGGSDAMVRLQGQTNDLLRTIVRIQRNNQPTFG